jgi:purine nucleosidase
VTDFRPEGRTPNALVGTSLDVGRFWDLLLDTYAQVAKTIEDQVPGLAVLPSPSP